MAFKIYQMKSVHIGHQFVQCQIDGLCDIKMKDFRHKARLVAESHMAEAPATVMYASVVSRDTVSPQ